MIAENCTILFLIGVYKNSIKLLPEEYQGPIDDIINTISFEQHDSIIEMQQVYSEYEKVKLIRRLGKYIMDNCDNNFTFKTIQILNILLSSIHQIKTTR